MIALYGIVPIIQNLNQQKKNIYDNMFESIEMWDLPM